jgi:O-antigen biosynthesis protein
MQNPPSTPPAPTPDASARPRAAGKFVFVEGKKLYLRGVTYGPFRPQPDGSEYGDHAQVEADFSRMASAGINAVRTYTVPPRWVLDTAQRFGLWVLVGLPWEQHVAFLNDAKLPRQIEQTVREGVRACAGHPAVLGYAIGNEIPSGIVRWHGHRAIEQFIRRLYTLAKALDPEALVAYVNYPSTEYLELPFIDLFCFNVYLESPAKFDAYLARLQNLAGDRPLILAEIGFDSRRNGESAQAASLDWQARLAFENGCAGVFTFAWTDEWHRSGRDILDWDFGLTRRDRGEKPALAAVQKVYQAIPFAREARWPRISVVVCTYNGTATLAESLAGLQAVEYPDFEVIVVNDGSSPGVAEIAGRFPVRLINIPHSGLSAARNCGMEAATGSIVAYLDDDAWPDPQWLQYLAHTFTTTDFAAVGGPNIPPPQKSIVARCVAQAPGGPMHVLLSDREAEHIPGCNMAFRKTVLQAIGGFDPQFRVAGDDVDLCWRLTDSGYKIGFHPGAMVWHHRRQRIITYWKQQSGYGRAEALLERKWPAKYNAAGQPAWHGRIYGAGRIAVLGWGRSRIYHGTWGSALFQSLYEPAPSSIWSLARMPEWYLVIFKLALLTGLSLFWAPLIWALPLLLLAMVIPVVQALASGWRTPVNTTGERLLVAWLHLLQPLARLRGRIKFGLTPWRPRRLRGFAWPGLRTVNIWSERWRSPFEWLTSIEAPLEEAGASIFRGGDFDAWDLEVRGGVLGSIRLRILIEEHGAGKQLVCVRAWPCTHLVVWLFAMVNAVIAAGALADGAWIVSVIFGGISSFCFLGILAEWAGAMAALLKTLHLVKSKSMAPAPAPAAKPGAVAGQTVPAP